MKRALTIPADNCEYHGDKFHAVCIHQFIYGYDGETGCRVAPPEVIPADAVFPKDLTIPANAGPGRNEHCPFAGKEPKVTFEVVE